MLLLVTKLLNIIEYLIALLVTPPPPICSERNDVTSKTETEPENRF